MVDVDVGCFLSFTNINQQFYIDYGIVLPTKSPLNNMKSPFYNPSTALNAVAVAVGPAGLQASQQRTPRGVGRHGTLLCQKLQRRHVLRAMWREPTMVAMVKHVITGCCVKGKYETNKHTNKRTNKQIKKHMFIKHGFSKTYMFLPWHVPVHYATKMGKTLKNWSIQKNVAHVNWTNQTYENLSWVHAIISFWPATT